MNKLLFRALLYKALVLLPPQ